MNMSAVFFVVLNSFFSYLVREGKTKTVIDQEDVILNHVLWGLNKKPCKKCNLGPPREQLARSFKKQLACKLGEIPRV